MPYFVLKSVVRFKDTQYMIVIKTFNFFSKFAFQPTCLHDFAFQPRWLSRFSLSQAYTKPTQSLHDTYTKTALLRREAYTTEAD